jgi:hypothetical protein
VQLQADFYILVGVPGLAHEYFCSLEGNIELPEIPKVRDVVDVFGGRLPPQGSFAFDGKLQVVTVSTTIASSGGEHHFIALDTVLATSREEAARLERFLESEMGFFVMKKASGES